MGSCGGADQLDVGITCRTEVISLIVDCVVPVRITDEVLFT